MISAKENQSWLDAHENTTLLGEGSEWLTQLREDALERFEKVGLPGVRDEDWRYTNLTALKNMDYSLSVPTSLNYDLAPANSPRLVFVDGHLDPQASTGVCDKVHSLKGALEQVKDVFNTTLPAQQHGFTALNTAYAQDGYVIQLQAGQVLDGVLEVIFVSQTDGTVSHNRNIILAGANSKCTIVQESDDAFHMGGVFINQAKSSQLKNHNIALSGLVTRNDIHTNLLGQGAHMEMNGLVLGQGRQHIDNHTQVRHMVPNCTSDEYYKTVLDDHSRSVFRGRIIVAQDAQLTVADQQNNNLLLSDNAEADCKPQLEIYADDVKCSHGATMGQLDPTALFYLKSRGIDEASAQALLTFAFANEVIERTNVESVRDELSKIIAGELLSGLEELI